MASAGQVAQRPVHRCTVFYAFQKANPYRLQRMEKSDLKRIETWPGDTTTCGRSAMDIYAHGER